MNWWNRLLSNALSHPGGMAYSPADAMLLGIGGMILFGYMTYSALRKGSVPRAKPFWGELPPELGTKITREKQPKAFWRNVWIGVILIVVAAITFVLGLLEAIYPGI